MRVRAIGRKIATGTLAILAERECEKMIKEFPSEMVVLFLREYR